MSTELQEIKPLVVIANRILAEVGLASGELVGTGHVSMRLPSEPDKFVVKGRGYAMDVLPKMRPRDKVVILKGHGVVTGGKSPADAVMTMARLEHQAKLNWQLYCAAGPNYPYVSDELLAEVTDRTEMEDLPHFATRGVRIKRGGTRWDYLAEIVARDLD